MRFAVSGREVYVSRTMARGKILSALESLRPHQWVKNLLIFAPVITGHRLQDREALSAAVLAFAAFCLTASGVYLINDLLDVKADRLHPLKSRRPIASGRLAPAAALGLAALVLTGAIMVALPLPGVFLLVLGIYFALATGYSVHLKQLPILDVLLLASLYTLRVVAGGMATGIPLTPYFLAFFMFLFLSLAFAKRHAELVATPAEADQRLPRRGYRPEDLPLVESLGPISGYLSVLVLALYLQTEVAHQLYTRPYLLWLICPVLLYWLTRVWLIARRKELHEDPILFALHDPASWGSAIVVAVLLYAAT